MTFPLVQPLTSVPDVGEALLAFADQPGLLLLDSAAREEPRGRYSFLTADPWEIVQLESVRFGDDPFARLRELTKQFAATTVPDLPPFQGGAAGLLGYELGGAWERLPSPAHDEFALPHLCVGLYDWVLAWDHFSGQAWIIAHGWPETDLSARDRRARQRIGDVQKRLSGRSVPAAATSAPVRLQAPLHPLPDVDGVTSNFTRDKYLATVERVIEYIRAGDIFQANLSQRLTAPAPVSPVELYLQSRRQNPAPFAGYFACDDWAVISASPERFLQVEEDVVSTRPIKGTRGRRSRPEADLYTRDALRESEKDRAENTMIVDLLRNDLSRVCLPGTIEVPQLCVVETYETVQHLVSEVRGRLRPGHDFWDLLQATFPGGSITGAPKIRAMEIITELEQVARGAYCGSLFYCGFDGRADSSILIRTITQRGGWLQFPVGGGVIVQSDPESEYEETLTKARGMLRTLAAARAESRR
ncbi:Aminodeoxychorismate synthase component 1 [Maioricimonas rarisocia]|uniref:aminodeoxychorismate synthase n=1 Tax=Maioricimonas rarisocia TaxID=2528026 RepID=A0A517Z3P3_9PLAN|nr:aminodeoxychorismate synthase component I [Maioricimonas rarisocia]QDU37045.1 Aminodeoxychorismate synthase component 1 [Maioricimonas rarisocia]